MNSFASLYHLARRLQSLHPLSVERPLKVRRHIEVPQRLPCREQLRIVRAPHHHIRRRLHVVDRQSIEVAVRLIVRRRKNRVRMIVDRLRRINLRGNLRIDVVGDTILRGSGYTSLRVNHLRQQRSNHHHPYCKPDCATTTLHLRNSPHYVQLRLRPSGCIALATGIHTHILSTHSSSRRVLHRHRRYTPSFAITAGGQPVHALCGSFPTYGRLRIPISLV